MWAYADIQSSVLFWYFSGDGNGKPLQSSCLGDPMDRGAWQATVLGLKNQTWFINSTTKTPALSHYCWMLWTLFSKCTWLFPVLKLLTYCILLKAIQLEENSTALVFHWFRLRVLPSSINSSKFYWLAHKLCEIKCLTTDAGSLRDSRVPWEHSSSLTV